MKYLVLTFTLALLFIYQAKAQLVQIKGGVQEKNAAMPLIGANVILTSLKDSTTKIVATDPEGIFLFENVLPNTSYLLKISYIGYKNYEKTVSVASESINLGAIALNDDNSLLKEVKIEGKLPAAVQKADTTQFDSKAFKTNRDANAEDLVQKMPGISMEKGKIQAQGEDVKQVLIDGKPFFGNDAASALKNLPAEVIDKIQVFDQLSEQSQFTGFNDGQTNKTLNIITKASMRNGNFGKIYGGYGYEDKYMTGGNINLFNGDRKITLLAQSNNINQQNFSSEDLLGVVGNAGQRNNRGGGGQRGGNGGGSNGGGGRTAGGSDANDFLVGQQNGISTTHAFGVNYTDSWGKKINVTGSYFFNMSENNSLQTTHQTFLSASDSGQVYQENSHSFATNMNHRLNFRFEYKINENNSLLVRPRLSLQQNRGISGLLAETSRLDALLNHTNNDYVADLLGYNLNNQILFRHRFKKVGRTISVDANTTYTQNSGNSDLLAQNIYYTDPITELTLDQNASLLKKGWAITSSINYTEPINKNNLLQFNYGASYTKNDANKATFSYDQQLGTYSRLDTTLTSTFVNNYMTQQAGAGYRYQNDKVQLLATANYQWAQLLNDQLFPFQSQLNRNFNNVLPSVNLQYKFSQDKNLRLNYRTSTSPPSVDQLQNVINNSNSLQLTTGNPDLKQDYRQMLILRYNATQAENSRMFFALISGTIVSNYIGNSTTIAQRDTLLNDQVLLAQGAQLAKPVNLDGYLNVRSFVNYGMPLGVLKTNLNLNLSAMYTRTPGLVNEQLNYANTQTFGGGITLSSNISEKLDFTISSNANINYVENTLNSRLNSNYYNQVSNLRFNWIFGKGFLLQANLNHQFYKGLTQGFNQNYLLATVSFGKKIFKKQQGEIKFTVFDVLKQNNSIQRNITEVYIEDVQTAVLQRYGMLVFTYTFRNF